MVGGKVSVTCYSQRLKFYSKCWGNSVRVLIDVFVTLSDEVTDAI